MKLEILEFNMFLLVFGIFTGIIIALILMFIWGTFKKDDNDKRDNKDISCRTSNMDINNFNVNREYRSNNRCNSILQTNDPEETIEDLIICHMLGLF